jgi:hypothetical protein
VVLEFFDLANQVIRNRPRRSQALNIAEQGFRRCAMTTHLQVLRADFDQQAGRSLALPLAGAIVWAIVGIAALVLSVRDATLVLLFGSGAIFPLGLALSRLLNEKLMSNTNSPVALMGMSVLMVNLLWALHLTLFIRDLGYLPLSLGIGLGLHWIVFSWIIHHPLGIIHVCLRTMLVTGLWWLFPSNQLTAVGVVIAYAYSVYALATRRKPGDPQHLPA